MYKSSSSVSYTHLPTLIHWHPWSSVIIKLLTLSKRNVKQKPNEMTTSVRQLKFFCNRIYFLIGLLIDYHHNILGLSYIAYVHIIRLCSMHLLLSKVQKLNFGSVVVAYLIAMNYSELTINISPSSFFLLCEESYFDFIYYHLIYLIIVCNCFSYSYTPRLLYTFLNG